MYTMIVEDMTPEQAFDHNFEMIQKSLKTKIIPFPSPVMVWGVIELCTHIFCLWKRHQRHSKK